MKRPAAYGIVVIAAADVRRAPRHDSELRNQLLLGEAVRIQGSRSGGQWLRVAGLEDGYSGWMRSWALIPAGALAVRRWQARSQARITSLVEPVLSADSGRVLMPAFFASRIQVLRARGGGFEIQLPDGRGGTVTRGSIRLPGQRGCGLGERLSAMMGIPYLWGGRTHAGLDCSGFTQLVFAEQGIAMPRDARDQFRSARPLEPGESTRLGDLVFFGRPRERVSHVGIMRERGTYVHCRGSVREASLDPHSALYEKELSAQLRGFRRPEPDAGKSRKRRALRGKSA